MFPGNDLLADGLAAMFSIIMSPDLVGGIADLNDTVAEYNTDAYSFAQNINSTVIKPLAATVLAIILVLDLARIGSRFDGDQKLGVQQVATAVIKAVLVIVAIQNVDLILGAINEIGDKAIAAAGSGDGSGAGGTTTPTKEALKEVDLIGQLGTMGILILPWIVGIAASIIVKVIVFVRFAEIYVLTAGATLPIVFMAHPETKGIAVGYLKKYAAAVLQGFVLIVVVKLFQFFEVNSGGSGITTSNLMGSTITSLPNLLLGSVVYLFFIITSGRLARALVGE